MVLIISADYEGTPNFVIDWLTHRNIPYMRVNDKSPLVLEKIVYEPFIDIYFSHEKYGELRLSQISSVWFRHVGKGFIKFHDNTKAVLPSARRHLNNETNTLERFIVKMLEQKPSLGRFYAQNSNKLESLHIAQQVGLKIPFSTVLRSKNELVEVGEKHERVITKGVQETFLLKHMNENYVTFTEEFKKTDLNKIPRNFFPSFFQELIEKEIEVRVFYLNGQSHSCAIFSQEIQQTSIDYRKYPSEIPNRYVPYKLCSEIEDKIHEFMTRMNYTTGSLDFIVDKAGEYFFLEVNPIGQYAGISNECHFYLNQLVADYLSQPFTE